MKRPMIGRTLLLIVTKCFAFAAILLVVADCCRVGDCGDVDDDDDDDDDAFVNGSCSTE